MQLEFLHCQSVLDVTFSVRLCERLWSIFSRVLCYCLFDRVQPGNRVRVSSDGMMKIDNSLFCIRLTGGEVEEDGRKEQSLDLISSPLFNTLESWRRWDMENRNNVFTPTVFLSVTDIRYDLPEGTKLLLYCFNGNNEFNQLKETWF